MLYRGANKSLALPGRKKSLCFCQNGVNILHFQRLALQVKKLDDSSRLDYLEIACVLDMLSNMFAFWSD